MRSSSSCGCLWLVLFWGVKRTPLSLLPSQSSQRSLPTRYGTLVTLVTALAVWCPLQPPGACPYSLVPSLSLAPGHQELKTHWLEPLSASTQLSRRLDSGVDVLKPTVLYLYITRKKQPAACEACSGLQGPSLTGSLTPEEPCHKTEYLFFQELW